MSNSSSSVQKIVEKTGKKLVNKAKSITKVLENMSSSESSVMTSSIADQSIDSVHSVHPEVVVSTPLKQKFKDIVTSLVSHKKFKWVVLTGILIIILFFYFKSQNKSSKRSSEKLTNDEKFKIVLDSNGKPTLIDTKNLPEKENKLNKTDESKYISQMEQLANIAQNNPHQMTPQQISSLQLASQQMALQQMLLQKNTQEQTLPFPPSPPPQQNQQMYIPQQNQQMPVQQQNQQMPVQQQTQQMQVQQQTQQMPVQQQNQQKASQPMSYPSIEEYQLSKKKKPIVEDSSEEDVSEDENISAHNLTLDEMEAINKQLDNIS